MKLDKQHRVGSLCNRSILWLWTEELVKWDDLSEPLFAFIYRVTSTFSAPRSEHSREGNPYLRVASMKLSRTVAALLSIEHFRNVIIREYPSMPPWTTNPHRISLCKPLMCHKAFGPGTLYFLRTVACVQQRRTLTGSWSQIISLTLWRGTKTPLLLRNYSNYHALATLRKTFFNWLNFFP